jgi:hypothetical protein
VLSAGRARQPVAPGRPPRPPGRRGSPHRCPGQRPRRKPSWTPSTSWSAPCSDCRVATRPGNAGSCSSPARPGSVGPDDHVDHDTETRAAGHTRWHHPRRCRPRSRLRRHTDRPATYHGPAGEHRHRPRTTSTSPAELLTARLRDDPRYAQSPSSRLGPLVAPTGPTTSTTAQTPRSSPTRLSRSAPSPRPRTPLRALTRVSTTHAAQRIIRSASFFRYGRRGNSAVVTDRIPRC